MAYIGKQPIVGNFVKLDAITTSATATYNLLNGGVAYFPQTANNCIVSLNGVIQSPTSAYTISGSTIVFSDALTASDSIDFILVLGDVLNIGTPSDATVGFAKVTSNLITGATSETSIDGADSVLIYDDSASALRKMTRTNFVSGIGGTNTPAFFVLPSTDQTSIADSVATQITFDTERFDTDNAFASNTFTVPSGKGGKYFFSTTVFFDSANYLYGLELFYYVNDSVKDYFFTYLNQDANNLTQAGANLNSVLDLSVGDTVKVYIRIDVSSAGTFTLNQNTTTSPRIWWLGYKLIGV
jgi:hypothetical protein